MPSARSAARPVVLVIRDGWGQNPHPEHDAFNAVKLARTPVDHELRRIYPTTLIRTSGEDVGLPVTEAGPTMGNSEVGHQNIGAGRIVDQEVMRLTRAIRDGRFFVNPGLRSAFVHTAATGGRVHLMGLISDGQVHSDLGHLLALIDLAHREGCPPDRLLIHAFMDGRDTAPTAGLGFMQIVEAKLRAVGIGRVASVMGRFYAMDRDHRWERVERAYRCLTMPIDNRAPTAEAAIAAAYAAPAREGRRGDEFIEPTQIAGWCPVAEGDSVIFFNFRGDRPRELTKAFVLSDAAWAAVQGGGFPRGPRLDRLNFVTMTGYERELPVTVAFEKPEAMTDILGEVVARAGLTQLRCAETEKFPHVTFFFNDYREAPFPGERRVIVASPKDVATYDLKPEMSAAGVCDAVVASVQSETPDDLIVVNFANGDMVGHTGVLPAAVRACEVVDECVGRVVKAVLARGGEAIVTADHGNAEQMWDPVHACPHTAHTNFDVPLTIVGARWEGHTLRTGGRLADIAPTLLAMMGLPQPAAMTGTTLLEPA